MTEKKNAVNYEKLRRRTAARQTAGKTVTYVLLSVWAVIVLFPFYWMLLTSVKSYGQYNSEYIPQFFTLHPTFQNYADAFAAVPLGRYLLNTLIFTTITTALMMIVILLAAYAFARLRFKGRDAAFALLLSLMMIPFEMLIITNYTTVVNLKVYDTLYALILPFTSSIFYTYILKNFFDSVSDSLYWSARIDGSSNWRFLWKVMVPMARPSLMTIILLNGLASWNSFMWPMYVIVSKENRTLPWGLQVFTTEAGSYPELLMAASTVVVFPVVILFLFARKYIVRGVARGGLKG